MKMRETSGAEDKKLQVNNKSEYQIERLHIIGDENPASGLKNKVKGFQFKQKIQVPDPVHKTINDEPMKPFMVNQLTMAFERNKIILSPYDDVLHKQLIDYEIERISQSGEPVFTSKNEHFVDALGLAYLAFVLEFPNLTGGIKEIENTTLLGRVENGFSRDRLIQKELASLTFKKFNNPWDNANIDPTELRGDRPSYYKMPTPKVSKDFMRPGGGRNSNFNWGSRSSINGNRGYRSSW